MTPRKRLPDWMTTCRSVWVCSQFTAKKTLNTGRWTCSQMLDCCHHRHKIHWEELTCRWEAQLATKIWYNSSPKTSGRTFHSNGKLQRLPMHFYLNNRKKSMKMLCNKNWCDKLNKKRKDRSSKRSKKSWHWRQNKKQNSNKKPNRPSSRNKNNWKNLKNAL